MTTPVSNFQDILNAMEQNPALRNQLRSYILTEELLQLPTQFVLLRADVDELKVGQARLEEHQGRLEERQGRLEGRMDRLEEGQVRLEGRMDRLEGRFGNVEGHQYEERATSRIIIRAHVMGIEYPQIALAQTGPVRQQYHDFMVAAMEGGLVSYDEYEDLSETDLILRGGNRCHAVVEISLGADRDDIRRAVRRAGILNKATGEPVTPVVVTPSPHPVFVQEAEASNVRVMNIPARSGS